MSKGLVTRRETRDRRFAHSSPVSFLACPVSRLPHPRLVLIRCFAYTDGAAIFFESAKEAFDGLLIVDRRARQAQGRSATDHRQRQLCRRSQAARDAPRWVRAQP